MVQLVEVRAREERVAVAEVEEETPGASAPALKAEQAADKGAPPRKSSPYYFTNFTAVQEAFIANATDINNSDIDYCDVDGDVYIAYSWGNQQGTEFLGAAEVKNATVSSWLRSYF